MYNLLISYYFSILFDVLHEKFGLRASIMSGSILTYYQTDSVRLLCEYDLKKLLPIPREQERLGKK